MERVQNALCTLFEPAWPLFFASLAAYLLGQFLDITLFERLKKATNGRYLGFRAFMSTSIAGFVDHCFFTWLAFCVLKATPVDSSTLFWGYIVYGYGMRFFMSFLSPLVLIISRSCVKPGLSNTSETL
jgi:uncharacterized integral membrane protein (TIGR00697 family)